MTVTSDIPIVFAGVPDPVGLGIAGKNATGISSKIPIDALLKKFKSIVNFSKLGIVHNDSGKEAALQIKEIKQLEGALGFQSVPLNPSKIADVDALFLTTQCISTPCVGKVTGVAHNARIPIASPAYVGEDSGVRLTVSANALEQGQVAARAVAEVLKGEKPSSIQIGNATKIDMIMTNQ
jgi:putative ABC transport system substrate-binding protein